MRQVGVLGVLAAAVLLGGAVSAGASGNAPFRSAEALPPGAWVGDGTVTGRLAMPPNTVVRMRGSYHLTVLVHANGSVIRGTEDNPSFWAYTLAGQASGTGLGTSPVTIVVRAVAKGELEVRGTGARPTFAGYIPFEATLNGRRLPSGTLKWVVHARLTDIRVDARGCNASARIIEDHPHLAIGVWTGVNLTAAGC